MAALPGSSELADIPTLSEIKAWDVWYSSDAAETWRAAAQRWVDALEQQLRELRFPGGTWWAGYAAKSSTAADAPSRSIPKLSVPIGVCRPISRRCPTNLMPRTADCFLKQPPQWVAPKEAHQGV